MRAARQLLGQRQRRFNRALGGFRHVLAHAGNGRLHGAVIQLVEHIAVTGAKLVQIGSQVHGALDLLLAGSSWARRRRICVGLTAQRLDQVGQHLGQLARHQGEIAVEALVVVARGAFLDDLQRLHRFDGQAFVQHEADLVAPGHGQARALLAGGDVAADIVRFQGVALVRHLGLAFARGAHDRVLVDREAGRGYIRLQPFRHGADRRALHTQAFQRQLIDGLQQQLDHLVSLGRAGRVHHQPAVHRVNPHGRGAEDGEGARQQLVGDALFQFLHGLFAGRETLGLFHFQRAGGGHLVDHGRRQQLLLGFQLQQELAADGVHQRRAGGARRGPALAHQVHASGGCELLRRQRLLEQGGRHGPRGG